MSDSNFKEDVRARIDLVALVERTVPIKRKGHIMFANCPFHSENTPSLAIYPDQGRWRCYGACQTGGDCFEWVMKRDNVDFVKALKTLAAQAGLEMPEFSHETEQERDERHKAADILKLAVDYYHHKLMNEEQAQPHRDYLAKRGFPDTEMWQERYLGAAGKANGLLALFQKRGVDMVVAKKIGLIGSKDGHDYDWFRERIIMPIIQNGQIVYITSRAINDEIQPKYLHLPNGQFVRKVPYNVSSRSSRIVIVEGPMDVLAVEALAGDSDVGAMGLQGLSADDPALVRALKHRERIYIGLDSHESVNAKVVDAVGKMVGAERAYLLSWPDKDAADWRQSGATSEEFESLLEYAPKWVNCVVDRIASVEDEAKPEAVKQAVEVVMLLPTLAQDQHINTIKKLAKPVVQNATISEMVKIYRKATTAANGNGNGNGHSENGNSKGVEPNSEKPRQSYYYIKDGEMWYGGDKPTRVTRGGCAEYCEMVTVDDGEATELVSILEIKLTDGTTVQVRIPAEEMNESGKVSAYIKKAVGPLFTIEARQGPFLIPAIELTSEHIARRKEIARTGWVETKAGWAYCTPNGVVGNLPPDTSVALPRELHLDRYCVKDDGDEAFKQGIKGLALFLRAFDKAITYPALAFALTPPAAKWCGTHKFLMHFVGETGSLKTETAKTLMSLYGPTFAKTPPLQSWRSTVNSIEMLGFWLPGVLGLVDDYKPIIVAKWEFAEMVQRYADQNARMRLSRNIKMQSRQAMRWWLLSTGEDLPTGESSVLARMVALRFPRRSDNGGHNANLADAQKLSQYFPTVLARWAAWLLEYNDVLFLESTIESKRGVLMGEIQKRISTPNVGRIAHNVAMLWVIWESFWEFVGDAVGSTTNTNKLKAEFKEIALEIALAQSVAVQQEKPTAVFMDALQEGLDSGRWKLANRNEAASALHGSGIAGFYDSDGVYLLPAMYNEVAKWLRESGQQLGFTKHELVRLLGEEGIVIDGGSKVIYVGAGITAVSRRVWCIKRGVIKSQLDKE